MCCNLSAGHKIEHALFDFAVIVQVPETADHPKDKRQKQERKRDCQNPLNEVRDDGGAQAPGHSIGNEQDRHGEDREFVALYLPLTSFPLPCFVVEADSRDCDVGAGGDLVQLAAGQSVHHLAAGEQSASNKHCRHDDAVN